MVGGIYTSERCTICGAGMKDNGRDGVVCSVHRKQRALNLFVKFPGVFKRFKEYAEASRFLTGVRFKTDEGSFDSRDYRKDNPLGFENLVSRYFEIKAQTVKPGTLAHIKYDLTVASEFFGQLNVKEIGYAEIEDFILSQKDVSDKTRHNRKANLHAFFVWLVKRRVMRKDEMPEFPELNFSLGFRKTIDKATQEAILEEIQVRTTDNPRIYLAFRILCTYVAIRPGELRGILEGDLDRKRGLLTIRDHKTTKHIGAKKIPLLEEDMEAIRSLPQGTPAAPIFRHEVGDGFRKVAGAAFGPRFLYKHWIIACQKLGIEGVDLYGGCRHSSMQHLREQMSPESVKRLSLHTTNKALDRYLEIHMDELRAGYAKARSSAPILHLQKTKADSSESAPTNDVAGRDERI
jgi:integrase